MTLKCLNCDCLNPDGATKCFKCGQSTLYRPKNQSLSGFSISHSNPSSVQSNAPQRILASFFLIIFCFFIIYKVQETRSHYARCSAEAPGLLNTRYKEVKVSKLFITFHTRYEVSYVFHVDEREYAGQDSMRNAPSSQLTVVFYNPANPKENYIEKQANWAITGGFLLAAFLGGLGVYLLFKKQVSRE